MEKLPTPDPPEIRMHHVPPRVQTPPSTPSPRSQFPSIASHTSPLHSRSPWQSMQPTPHPLTMEHILPTGYPHQFSYTRSRSRDLSSHASSASGRPGAGSGPASRSRSDRDRSTSRRPSPLPRHMMGDSSFTIEEMVGSEKSFSSDLEVIRPDSCEDAISNAGEVHQSDSESHPGSLGGLTRSIEVLDVRDRLRKERIAKRRQRWSQGSRKRDLGTSLGSDTDMEDVSGHNAREMAKKGRRQRPKIDDNEDDPSSTPEDHHSESWLDVEGSADENQTRPTTAGSDTNGRAAETLPFFQMEDIMQIDRQQSHDATPR